MAVDGMRRQEINVLSQCACEQLTKYMGSFIYGTKLWILMEFLAGGSVLDIMDSGYDRFVGCFGGHHSAVLTSSPT